MKGKQVDVYDPTLPPSASTCLWIHHQRLPIVRSSIIVFLQKSLGRTSTVTLRPIYTDQRKDQNLHCHSTKSSITFCMSYIRVSNGINSKPPKRNYTARTCTNGTIGGQKTARIRPSLKRRCSTSMPWSNSTRRSSMVMAPTPW